MLASARRAARQRPLVRLASTSSSSSETYDVVVVGGGPGGYVAAIKSAQLGLKTACVESRGRLGGTCLNVGCIPSKALLQSSHLYEETKSHFKTHGLVIDGEVRVDLEAMMANKAKSVDGLTGGIEYLFKKYKVDYLKGFGKLTGPNSVRVSLLDSGEEVLQTKNIMVATGSVPTPLKPCPVDNDAKKIVDSTGALELPEIPKKLAVVGGGVIGLEMGSVWRRLGSEVTVIEYLDRIVPGVDAELGKTYLRILKKQGMKFMLSTGVTASEVKEGSGSSEKTSVELTVAPSKGGDEKKLDFDVVLVATGRKPYTEGLGLEALGIETDRQGRVQVNEHFQTTVPSIYAFGDCIDGPMLAHKAEEEGIACAEIVAGFAGHVNYDVIPGVIYTHPELATAGRTEEQLKEAGVNYKVGTFPFSANSRARAVVDSEGLVKILTDAETDRILGVHIIGPNAGEMIVEGVLGMEYGASSEDIARTCHPHPTLSEAFKEACMAAYDHPIHF
mmetsp:Transcript_2460/g.8334  ORF Transcript_2460/g.8334 Transcript_2460/m.8334 type:complete len:502 (+) Transcript_2460:74-1579(+)